MRLALHRLGPLPPSPPTQLWDYHTSSSGRGLGKAEALWLAAFLAWTPLLLWLSQCRSAAYLRLRTPLVLLSRVHRLLTSERRGRAA